MVVRIKVVLEQEEYSALLKLAISEMRSPEEQVRFMLIKHCRRLKLLSVNKGLSCNIASPRSSSIDHQKNTL